MDGVSLSLLFSRHPSSEHGDGSRGMSVFERILRCTLVFARHKRELEPDFSPHGRWS